LGYQEAWKLQFEEQSCFETCAVLCAQLTSENQLKTINYLKYE
jgi:hypothetical protein